MENKTKLKSIINELNHLEKDELYRLLWSEYVKEDFLSQLDYNDDFTDEDIDNCVKKYVYNGDYDSNIDSWTNINNIIEKRKEWKKAKLKIYNLPVEYSMYDTVSIEAETLEDAVRKFMEQDDDLSLPANPQYMDGSFRLSTDSSPYRNFEATIKELKYDYGLE